MRAAKLLRLRKDGSLGPLFIHRRQRIPVGEWLRAECHPTKGYALRTGWHCLLRPNAPHLTTRGRVWCWAEVADLEFFDRPERQGGRWVLAQWMKVIEEISC